MEVKSIAEKLADAIAAADAAPREIVERLLIDVAGLTLEALYGWFAAEPFDDDSREYVFVVRR